MKYAIVAHGGKQYLAEEGGKLEVDRMPDEVGKRVEFQEILLISDGKQIEVGSPYVSGATVKGTVLEHPNGKKIIVFKHHPKHRYRRTKGQRRRLTQISIEVVGASSPDEPASAPARKATAKPPAKRSAVKRSAVKPPAKARKTPTKTKSTRAKKK